MLQTASAEQAHACEARTHTIQAWTSLCMPLQLLHAQRRASRVGHYDPGNGVTQPDLPWKKTKFIAHDLYVNL